MQYVSEDNKTEFYDKLLNHLDCTFTEQKKLFPKRDDEENGDWYLSGGDEASSVHTLQIP